MSLLCLSHIRFFKHTLDFFKWSQLNWVGIRLIDIYNGKLKPLFEKLHQEISAETYNEIGTVFHENDIVANAAFYFRLAANMSYNLVLAESYNNLAGAYLNGGFLIDAVVASARAVEINPKINKVNYNLSRLRMKLIKFAKPLVDKYS